MTILLFANQAQTTLAQPVTSSQTTITVASGTGVFFPAPQAGQAVKISLVNATNNLITEVLLCTNITGNVLTVQRAQEGTVARAWSIGDFVINFMTAGTANAFVQTYGLENTLYSASFVNMATETGQVTTAPANANDLANKQYVDSVAQGIQRKFESQVATTGPITLFGLQEIDTYTTLAGDYVLVKNQSNSAQNGIYVASASAWLRIPEMNTWSEVPGTFTFIQNGFTNINTGWVTIAPQTGTIDVTPIVWSQFSSVGGYTAGTGLTLAGNQFSITNTGVAAASYGTASSVPTLQVNAQGQIVSASNTTISISANQINSLIQNTGLQNSSITVGSTAISLGGTLTSLSGVTISGLTNTLTNIANNSLVYDSITVNGSTIALGGSATVTAVNPYALTIGSGLSGSSYNGSAAITITNTAPDQIVSLTGAGTTVVTGTYPSFTITSNDQYLGTVTSITAGTGLSGGTITSSGTIAIANTGVTANSYGSASQTLTATVNAQGQLTSLAATSIAISNTQVSGLGSASTMNAGVANGVATLDSSGTLTLSQIPASLLGALKYQGTWNASTNTPTLTSSVGTQGFYYVVSVAGSTNLNGITDWQVNDWAIFNGSVWQKIDNTDLVTSVNGYTGTVILSYSDVGAPSTSGTNATGIWSISVTGNAGTVTNGVYTTGSYADPSWITSIATTKLSGTVTNAQLANSTISGVSLGSNLYTLTIGSGLGGTSYNGSGAVTITNTAPDQIVALTGTGTTVVTGTYPNFTITSNDAYVGTVTSITAGTGLNGGTITTSGTISIANTAVVAASYGAASKTLIATVNAQGQLTALADTPIAIANTQVSGLGTMSVQNANAVSITGGAIDGTTLGLTTPAAAKVTTLQATNAVTLAASTTSLVPLHFAVGVQPTTPVQGDVWNESTGLYFHNSVYTNQLNIGANNAGALSTPIITVAGTGATIDVSSVKAVLYSLPGWVGDYKEYVIPAATGLSLTDNSANYLVVVYNSGNPVYQITTNPVLITNSDVIGACLLWRSGTQVHFQSINWGLSTASRINRRLVQTQRYQRASGLLLGESTGNVITLTAGVVWYGVNEISETAVTSATNNADFYYHVAGVWNTTTASTYNNSQYDDGTGLQTLGPSKYAVNWVYRYLDGSGLPKLAYVLGSGNYTLAQALASLSPNPPPILSTMAILVGRIVVQAGAATATQIDSAFTQTFASTTVTNHNDLAGLQGGTTAEYFHMTSAEYTGTGTGNFVRATSPTLTTPNLGIPSALTLTNATGLPNAGLVNSSITINGSTVSLGGSTIVTATATNALTIGTGLTGTSYNGSTAVTIAIDSTVATLTGTQTLTNKVLSLQAGTTSVAPITFASGTNLTTATQGSEEFNGNNLFITGDTTNGSGRQLIQAVQFAKLATSASVASGDQFFTATVRPALLSGHLYRFKYELIFTKATAGTLTFGFTNSAATNFSPLNATVTLMQQGYATTSVSNIFASGAATTTSQATLPLADATGYIATIEGYVIPSANTRLQLIITDSAGTITSQLGSNFTVTDLGASTTIGNIG